MNICMCVEVSVHTHECACEHHRPQGSSRELNSDTKHLETKRSLEKGDLQLETSRWSLSREERGLQNDVKM